MARPIWNARIEPNGGPNSVDRFRPDLPPRARRSLAAPLSCARTLRPGALALALIPLAGCANFISPISQWRAAYDGNLFKKLTPEEMADASGPADSTNLLQRWLTPRGNPALKSSEPPTSTLVLGSDGWRPIAKAAPDPQADAEFQAALKLFQQGKFEEAEKQFTKIAKDRKQSTW